MKSWNELDQDTLMWMKFLGDFSPTVNVASRELKGYMYDGEGSGKVYINANELRNLAKGCNEAARWLDARFQQQSEFT